MTLSPRFFLPLIAAAVLLTGCDTIFGSKSDPTTDEIFEEGRIEPGLINEAEYVALFPFFTRGGDGAALQSPKDIYAGFDELLYVVDERGLHVLDQAGRPARFLPIDGGATNVIQDRRLDVYVTARRDTFLNGQTWNLPVVMHYSGITTGNTQLVDIIWHPFDEESRRFNRPDPVPTDEEVEFTGLAVLYSNDPQFNNSIYVTRRGPVNDRGSVIRQHNTVLEFSPEGVNTNAIVALNPTQPSLRSSVNPSDILTFVHPPQRRTFDESKSFIIAQSPYADGMPPAPGVEDSLRFAVLSVEAVETPDGIEYQPDTEKLIVAESPDRGNGFLYEEFKFENPTGLAYAADATQYLFVTDAGTDQLYIFTSSGIEGVAPPAGSTSTTPVVVTFGGEGDGAMEFNDPQGVTYFERTVYVADSGNDRISRFRLNTDFE